MLSLVTIVPTRTITLRDIDTVVHGDDYVAVAEDGHLNFLERVLENSMEIKRVGRIGPWRSSAGEVFKRVVSWRKGVTVSGAKDIGETIEMSTVNWSVLKPRLCRQQRDLNNTSHSIVQTLLTASRQHCNRCRNPRS